MAEKSDGNLWTKRPLSDEMIFAISEEVTSLRMELYPQVHRYISEYLLN